MPISLNDNLFVVEGSNEWKLFAAVPKQAYLAAISTIGILLLISLGLLAHLIIFHFYLSKYGYKFFL